MKDTQANDYHDDRICPVCNSDSRTISRPFNWYEHDEAGTQEIPLRYLILCQHAENLVASQSLGFQSNAQTDVVYGEKKSQILMDGIGAIAAFRINGSKGAAWLAGPVG